MVKDWKNIALTILAAILLAGFAFALPSGAITPEARENHMNESVDDEYAFLFE